MQKVGKPYKSDLFAFTDTSFIGDVKTISGQFKRTELAAEHKLNVSGCAMDWWSTTQLL